MSQKNIDVQQDKVDSYLITTNITFLAAFIILLSVNNGEQSNNFLTNISIIVSIIALSLSLIFSLWHKYRISIKNDVYSKLKKEAMDKFSKQLDSMKKTVRNGVLKSAGEFFLLNVKKNMTDNEIKKGLLTKIEEDTEEDNNTIEPLVDALSENFANNFSEINNIAFRKPLKEKFSKPKYFIDYLSQKFRYIMFAVGLISFLTAIISKTLQ
ncbi:hypothetical protein KJ665_01375 [Patescibacteria group bacterium]|nr:hypothetical protein [Patescibacteria group bacterium]